jgi:S1-C subfamily serine protease
MFCSNCGKNLEPGLSFCEGCGTSIHQTMLNNSSRKTWIKKHKKFIIISGSVLLVILWLYFREDVQTKNPSALSTFNQEKIAASIVNILCPGIEDDLSDATGGSGTIITSDGIVLTNAHIIPQDEEGNPLTDECLVVLPNPTTGEPEEIYIGIPLIVPILSSEYDLAAIEIDKPFVDEEGVIHGSYSRVFPEFDDTNRCFDENVKLGESVRIFGYPALSGGYSLTITDGIVSSFPGEGLIVTSAKISSGNSGGLAVDQYGCMIGIPSMVSSDDIESLGVVISNNLIREFIDKLEALNKLLE